MRHKDHDPVFFELVDRSEVERVLLSIRPHIDARAPFAYFQEPETEERANWLGLDGKPMVAIRWDPRPACRLLSGLCLHPDSPDCERCLTGLIRLAECAHNHVEVRNGLVRCSECWDILEVLEQDDPPEMDDPLEDDDPHEDLALPSWLDYVMETEARLSGRTEALTWTPPACL